MNGRIVAAVMNYLEKSKAVFTKGKVRFSTCDGVMKISYHHNQEPIDSSKTLQGDRNEVVRQIQDFFLDCFFDFERDGGEINAGALWRVLWISEDAMRQLLSRIYKKLKIHEERFLHKK